MRQGCPLSAYLFILAIKVLANKIRKDPDIKGIKIDKKEIKISLLADDITLILKYLSSLENSLRTFKLFQYCSGLKLNIDKSKVKHIGKILNLDHFPPGLSWIKTPLQTMGIFITNNDEENLNLNFKPRIANLTNLLNVWKQRNLSLKGKIAIIITLALAPLIYLLSTINVPDKAIAQVNNIIHAQRPKTLPF